MQANRELRPINIIAINVPSRNSKDFNYSEYFLGKGGDYGTHVLTGRDVLSERSGWMNAQCQIFGTGGTYALLQVLIRLKVQIILQVILKIGKDVSGFRQNGFK
ncbi:MAG: hypothetical protein JW765_10700 [Deltaproteobacteria bacterium]|nr:hypothetical protein [Candidatus Zymogenaceae bacterium]